MAAFSGLRTLTSCSPLAPGPAVKGITLDKATAEWLQGALLEKAKSSLEVQEKRLAVLKTSYEKINNRISRLYDAKFDNDIPEEGFIAKEKEYQRQLIEIKAQIEGAQRTNPNFLEDTQRTLELSKRLQPLYVKANYEEKAKILQLIASNYTLVDVTPVPKYRKPFSFIAEGLICSNWLPVLDDFRNWLLAEAPHTFLAEMRMT